MTAKKEPELVRLIAPSGALVSVTAEKAERLLGDSSWSKASASSAAKAPAKKAAKRTAKKAAPVAEATAANGAPGAAE